MPINPTVYLRALSDDFIAVRDEEGALLGIIPSRPPSTDTLRTPFGEVEVWNVLTLSVRIRDEQMSHLARWPGFIPLRAAPSAVPPEPIGSADPRIEEQADIGEPP